MRRSSLHRLALSSLALLPLLVPSGFAHGFVQTRTDGANLPMRWTRGCLRLELMAGGQLPEFVTSDSFLQAAGAAAAAWSTVVNGQGVRCSNMQMAVLRSPLASYPVEHDEVRSVQFRRDVWGRNTTDPAKMEMYPTNALAITSVFARSSTGEIVDADVEINATGPFRWSDLVTNPGDAVRGAADLQNTLTHEFGHVLGLDHTCVSPAQPNLVDHTGQKPPNCDAAPPDVAATTMFAAVARTDIERRTLAPDDMLAVCSIYPSSMSLSCPSVGSGGGGDDDDGGCSVAGGVANTRRGLAIPVTAGLLLLGLALSLRRQRRRR